MRTRAHTHTTLAHVHTVFPGCLVFLKAPRYFNIGDGGNREGLAADYYEQPEWSDFREAAYGHGKLYIANATHMRWDWHRDLDKECKVSYSTTIVNY